MSDAWDNFHGSKESTNGTMANGTMADFDHFRSSLSSLDHFQPRNISNPQSQKAPPIAPLTPPRPSYSFVLPPPSSATGRGFPSPKYNEPLWSKHRQIRRKRLCHRHTIPTSKYVVPEFHTFSHRENHATPQFSQFEVNLSAISTKAKLQTPLRSKKHALLTIRKLSQYYLSPMYSYGNSNIGHQPK